MITPLELTPKQNKHSTVSGNGLKTTYELRLVKKIYFAVIHFLGIKKIVENQHFQNLKNGKRIEINGREYIKVKLRFVDSLDTDSTKILLNLESEVESLRNELEKITKQYESISSRFQSMERLNVFLLAENKDEKRKAEEKFLKSKENYEKKLNEHKEKVKELNTTIAEIHRMNKETRIASQNHQNKINQLELDANKYKENIIVLKKNVTISQELLKQKDQYIKILTDRLIEKELTISKLSQNTNENDKYEEIENHYR